MRNKVFAGLCVGGPLDGRRVQHFAEVYAAMEMPAVREMASDAPVDVAEAIAPVFNYNYLTAFDTGFWLPEQVFRGEVYQHKTWDHPVTFLLRTLAAGYNPEGY